MTSSTHFPQQNHTTTTTTTSTTTNVHNNITKNSNHNNTVTFLFKNNTTTSPPSVTLSSSSSLGEQGERDDTHEASTGSYAANCCYNSFKLSPPFDSAMALTVLILLTALFFMGFFSIYIRKFADENNVNPTRRRRRRAAEAAAAAAARETTEYLTSGGKGVDPGVVGSLPVYVYKGGDVEQGIVVFSGKVEERECAICLSEFEEREWVKEIPSCGHVFHVECIDTWLTSHVTCPLCRTAEFFPVVVEKEERENDNNINTSVAKAEAVCGHVEGGVVGGSGVVEVQGNEENNGGGGSDTWQESVGDVGLSGRVRRTSSCSWFGERVVLHRSSSF